MGPACEPCAREKGQACRDASVLFHRGFLPERP